ncbi:MAG: hypothetical protein AAFQ27_07175 [Pseudomonadota bacterium]
MKLIGGLLGLATAVSLAATPAQAQSQQQVVTQFNDSTISRLLLDVGASWNIEGGPNGEKVYRASADGGVNFTLSPRACAAETGCVGLLLITVFTRNDQRSVSELDELLHRYNDLNPNGKAYRVEGGAVVLQGYINAVAGISYTNAQAQILVFGQELGKLRNELTAFSEGGR